MNLHQYSTFYNIIYSQGYPWEMFSWLFSISQYIFFAVLLVCQSDAHTQLSVTCVGQFTGDSKFSEGHGGKSAMILSV